jgi:spore germination cell wall hydrolase CwlJ-like protein
MFFLSIASIQPVATIQPIEEVIPEPAPRRIVSAQELECLATNVYHEARGEPYLGQLAVAQVTLNRVETKGFPDSICSVVYQPSQFSWTLFKSSITEKAAYQQALSVAKHALETTIDVTNGALFFHTVQIRRPVWAKSYEEAIVINNHIFYNKRK